MTSQPWMKFYPADWRADPALRSCSLSSRGMWMEMLAIMHEATVRGELTINGRPVSARQMASLAGCSETDAASFMSELERAGVFSRRKNGVIYSRRMERDENSARKNRENGKKGGNPSLSKDKGNVGSDNPPDKAQKPEARSQNKSGAIAPTQAAPSSPKDARDLLWTEGVPVGVRVLRLSEASVRSAIGKLLKASGDDAVKVLEVLHRAEADRVFEPMSWMLEAVKPKAPPGNSSSAYRDAVNRIINSELH